MKKNYTLFALLASSALLQNTINAQCGAPVNLGSASNMITLIRNGTSSIAADKDLNTVTFIHRNDAGLYGGSSGHIRYDISTNGGTAWTLNQGVINMPYLYPHRYPNVAIYNPSANTNTANAYMSFMNPVIDSTLGAWIGVQTGVSTFNSTGTTNTYNQNGIGQNQCPNSLVPGATGEMWAIDAHAPAAITGFKVYKGVWNSGANDFVWNMNYSVTPTFISVPTVVDIDFNIAFDPTGNIGWFCFPAHLNSAKPGLGLYPVFYKTTDGGNTWNGPIEVDLTKFSCITSNVPGGSNVSMNPGNDLVVDANGIPHMITTVGSSTGYTFNYNAWHHMYDITMKDGLWVAVDLGNVNGSPHAFGVTTFATQWQAPQASRSKDGTKVFFTWTDNSNYSLGTQNSLPDLFGKAYNVTNGTWTQTKNFTSCNVSTAGKIMFPHIAAEVLEPNNTTYLIPTVYGEPSVTNNLDLTANFVYLDNVTFSVSEFSVTVPPAVVNILPSSQLLVCQNGVVNASVQNASDAIWGTGATGTAVAITNNGATSSYSVLVVAQAGCNTGTASITVKNMTVSTAVSDASLCAGIGATSTLSAWGNALSYTWTAGVHIDDSTTVVTPIAPNSIYTLLAGGTSCIYSKTVSVGLFPVPVLSVTGNNTVCLGASVTQTAGGGSNYTWSNGDTGDIAILLPSETSTFTLTDIDGNLCVTTKTFVITVMNPPVLGIDILSANNNTTAVICEGISVTLTGTGANSYTWSTGSMSHTLLVEPSVTTSYTVVGTGTNVCMKEETVEITVNGLPAVGIKTTAVICKGESVVLSGTGASTYTWSTGSTLLTTLVSPSVTTTYSVTGMSAEGCLNSATHTQTVDACVGIDKLKGGNVDLKVYPNPTNGEIFFEGNFETETKVLITNLIGQQVMISDLNDVKNTVRIENGKGIYFYQIISGGKQTVSGKIIVE
ncbi:MAG: T9SS type A sorting domain-containing protein [Bacteroidetes bacterium]|nr:T9SS type A sorting domain-containing protein [Bacteroidota bacterium]